MTSIYASLAVEMMFAAEAANGTYGTIGLHMQRIDAEHTSFQVALEPGPLTDMGVHCGRHRHAGAAQTGGIAIHLDGRHQPSRRSPR